VLLVVRSPVSRGNRTKSDFGNIEEVDELSTQLLQQYFVNSTAVISAQNQEIIDTVTQHMTIRVKNIASETIFCHNKATHRRDEVELNELHGDDYETGNEVD
jgi:hypothetical protein